MIYTLADTHGDFSRLKRLRLRKTDFLIISGDFGFIWNGGKSEKKLLKRLGKRKYPVLFVDGVHENFRLLSEYPVEEWNGGKTHKISGNLRHLMRGEVFNLGDQTVLALGGGQPREDDASLDEANHKLAFPTESDGKTALANLQRHGNKVDYIFSYEPPSRIADFLELPRSDWEYLCTYLDDVERIAEYSTWYFGSHHINKTITAKYIAVFDKLKRVNTI